MHVALETEERRVLEQALRRARRVRDWRRYQAVVLLADGQAPTEVAQALRASLSSVYNWATAWRRAGLAGLHDTPHGGRRRGFDAAGEQWLDRLLASDPQAQGYRATGWTVPLLQREAAAAGYALSAATLRRTLHRLGWRWKRPTDVMGRPDPEYAEKKTP